MFIHIDDMLIISKETNDLLKLKKLSKIEFKMKDLASTKRILGIDINRDKTEGILTLSQIGLSLLTF